MLVEILCRLRRLADLDQRQVGPRQVERLDTPGRGRRQFRGWCLNRRDVVASLGRPSLEPLDPATQRLGLSRRLFGLEDLPFEFLLQPIPILLDGDEVGEKLFGRFRDLRG